ncbi:MAG: PASTA domain-containing protein [Oscillospiraceae bacterium]|nr:PASTA domain-containing protein [Oscillospiraceae bacterium]
MKKESGDANEWANRTILSRTLALMVCGVLVFIPLLATLFQLMVLDHDKYEQMAIQNQTRSTDVTADRGMIYDRNMNILATSTTVENVFLDPNELKEKEQDLGLISTGLGEILEVEPGFILEQAADTTKRYKVVKRKIEGELSEKVREFINENDIQGVYLEPDTRRSYPYGPLCAQVLGFTRSDNVGAEGLEEYYDASLAGTSGKVVVTKGNYGSEMLYTYEKYYDADNGDSLVLTIDTSVQYYLEKNLETAIEKYDVQNGAFGIVADVNTGEILGMANLGSYDPNHYAEIYDEEKAQELESQYQTALLLQEGSNAYNEAMEAYNQAVAAERLRQWRNRAVSDGYEPGSTFKLITLAAALEERAVDLNSSFYCGGAANFAGRSEVLDCWKHEGHGQQNTSEALQNSCNIAFANIGLSLTGPRLRDYVKNFGLLEKTGIDLSGEAVGFFYSEAEMEPTANGGISNAISSAFGQTFKITPIQLVRAISAVVNGGYLLQPYVVDQVVDSDGNVVQKNERTVIRQVISEETSATMRELMEAVVVTGTAKNAKVVGYRVGGKTGTSEKIDVFDENGKRVDDKIVSFIGVAPIDDPKYVVLVALDTPSRETGIYISGGIMAAPTVRDIFSDILPYLGVEPDYTDADINKINVSMPNVYNLSREEAEAKLRERSLTCRVVGEGSTVTDMIPAPDSDVPGASEVILYMGTEKPTDLIIVPDFTGMGVAQASQTAADIGLYLQSKGADQSGADVSVTYQDVEAGLQVERGTTITVEFTDHSARD